jgi:hypothetical protein
MTDLSFAIDLAWLGRRREGTGAIQGDDLTFELSTSESMGSRGRGTTRGAAGMRCVLAASAGLSFRSSRVRPHVPLPLGR